MAAKPETIFKHRIRPLLNRLPRATWFKIQQVSIRGIPDFLGCVAGRFVALELKASAKHSPDALQQYNLNAIEKAGGVALTVFPENWDATLAFLKKLSEG